MSATVKITELDSLSEMQRDNIRRYILSPCPLQNVPKPKMLLFENKNENSKITKELPNSHKDRACTLNSKSKCQKSNENENFNKRETLTRKDFILKELIEMTKNSNDLKNFNLNVSLGVKPKYYQKWARNKKSSCKYIFPSLLEKFQTKERIRSETRQIRHSYSRRQRKRQSGEKHSRGNVPGSENQTESGDSIESKRKTASGIVYYDTNSSNKTGNRPEAPVPQFENSDGDEDSSGNELSYEDDDDIDNCEDPDDFYDGIYDNEKPEVEYSFGDETLLQQCTGRSEGRNSDTFPDPDTESLVNKEFSANTDAGLVDPSDDKIDEFYASGDSYKNKVKRTSLNSGFVELKREKYPNSNSKGLVQLSTKEISTSLLDSVAVPVKSPLKYVRRESLKFACRRITGMANLKLKKVRTGSLSVQNKGSEVFGENLNADKHVDACNINDQVQHFRYRKQNKTFGSEKTISLPARKDINRIPVKMADTSPRYTGPDNIIVDFESLRIAAHLQRLKSKSNSVQTELAIKLLKSTKEYDKIPYIDKNGFKTVVSGCVVK